MSDDAKAPRFIETVHRRGYRFIAPVVPEHESPPAPALASPAPPAVEIPSPVEAFAAPETHYARSGDVNIAYQVVGDGPLDLVFVMGWVSHLEYFWKEPSFARFLSRLASFSRLILFDKRGTGLSDRVTALPTLEERMDDVRAVMEAVGSERAALLGVSEGGPMCSLFAATYPEKTSALVMIGTYAKRIWDPDYPWAPTLETRGRFFDEIRDHWGGPVGLEVRAPSMAADPAFRAWWSTYLRMGASPGAALRLTQMNSEIDVRRVLPLVRVPTLVLHRTDDRCLLVEEGRYVAERIPGAKFVELPGDDHLPFVGDQDAMLDEIEEFLTGSRHSIELDRVLATVMCGYVAASGRAATARERLDRFYAHARKEHEWFRGRRIRHAARRLHQHLRRAGPRHPLRVRASAPRRRASASTSASACTPANATSGTTWWPGSRSDTAAQVGDARVDGRGAGLADREGSGRRLGRALRGSRRARAARRARRLAPLRGRTDGRGTCGPSHVSVRRLAAETGRRQSCSEGA